MTAKRNADGVLEIVKQGFGTQTFRVALLAALVSQTPIADGVWSTFGMESLSVRIARMTETVKTATDEVTNVKSDINLIKTDIKDLRANAAINAARLDGIEQSFTGFRVDFQKYQNKNVQ